MAQQRILCVAYGQAVKERRCQELMAAGYSVVGTTTVKHAAPLLVSNEFDLVIVGVQFTDEEKEKLVSLARDKYHIPVLLVCGGEMDEGIVAADRVFAAQGEEVLLKAAARLMHQKKAMAAAA
jgi:DNA-binding NtrC family response regulator